MSLTRNASLSDRVVSVTGCGRDSFLVSRVAGDGVAQVVVGSVVEGNQLTLEVEGTGTTS